MAAAPYQWTLSKTISISELNNIIDSLDSQNLSNLDKTILLLSIKHLSENALHYGSLKEDIGYLFDKIKFFFSDLTSTSRLFQLQKKSTDALIKFQSTLIRNCIPTSDDINQEIENLENTPKSQQSALRVLSNWTFSQLKSEDKKNLIETLIKNASEQDHEIAFGSIHVLRLIRKDAGSSTKYDEQFLNLYRYIARNNKCDTLVDQAYEGLEEMGNNKLVEKLKTTSKTKVALTIAAASIGVAVASPELAAYTVVSAGYAIFSLFS